MEYEDELERMRNRRRSQKSGAQHGSNTSRPRQSTDENRGARPLRRLDSEPENGRNPRRNHNDRYYDDSYEYSRHHSYHRAPGRHDGYENVDGRYDGYGDEDGYGHYDGYEDEDGYGHYDGYEDEDGYGHYDGYEDEGGYGRNGGYEDYEGRQNDRGGYRDRNGDHQNGFRRGGRQNEGSRSGKGTLDRKGGSGGMADNRLGANGAKGKGPKKKKRGFLMVLVLLILLLGAYFMYKYKQTGTGYWTIAVFGVDSRDGKLEKGALSDVEMICVIDRGTGDIKLVSVFRDTYLEINPDGTYHKINEAYFKGGHEQAVQALERNLDLSIDDYATFNWKAVVDAINILGGIDLEISDSEFKYINSFITETVESTAIGSHHLEHAGMNHLDGVQAVAYARLRLMDTDYNRTARQRLVIQLAMNKAKESDLKTLTALVQTILPQISTSIGIDDILPMARNIKKFHIGETGGFPFSRGETHIGKKDCVIPLTLESNVIQLHRFLYGTEAFSPSETVRQISAKVAADSGMSEVAENAPEAKVLGQKALEGTSDFKPADPGNAPGGPASEGSGGSGNSSGNSGSGDSSGNAASPPPAGEPEAPPQTEAPTETSQDEAAEESSSSEEENQDPNQDPQNVTTASDPGEGKESRPSFEESPAGPASPGETQPEVGPGMTQEVTEPSTQDLPPQTQTPAEETTEIGPGVPQ